MKNKIFSGLLKIAYIIPATILVIIDLSSKYAIFKIIDKINAKNSLTGNAAVELNPIINLVRVENTGIAFGLLNSISFGSTILSAVNIFIVLLLAISIFYTKNKIEGTATALIIAGATGNIYDRITLGHVRDFIDVHFGTWHFPAFNIADALICIGVFALLISDLITKKKAHDPQ